MPCGISVTIRSIKHNVEIGYIVLELMDAEERILVAALDYTCLQKIVEDTEGANGFLLAVRGKQSLLVLIDEYLLEDLRSLKIGMNKDMGKVGRRQASQDTHRAGLFSVDSVLGGLFDKHPHWINP